MSLLVRLKPAVLHIYRVVQKTGTLHTFVINRKQKRKNYVCLLLLVLCSNILASSWVLYWVLITYV